MGSINFDKSPKLEPVTAGVVENERVTSPANVDAVATVPTPSTPSEIPMFDDQNIGFEDIILPRVNIVQKVGDLSEIFTPGEIVLKQALVIYSPAKGEKAATAPLNVTVLGFKKTQFAEKVAGGAQGILAHSEAEVVKHGGTLDYKEWQAAEIAVKAGTGKGIRLFQRLATGLMLVDKPEFLVDEDHIEFPYECEGKYYALVLWSMKGTAYTNAAKACFTARKIGHLRQGYSKQSWSLSTKMEKYGDNYAAIPVLRPAGKTSSAFQAFMLDVLGCN